MSYGVIYSERDNRNEDHSQHGGDDDGLHVGLRWGLVGLPVAVCFERGFVADGDQGDDEERVHDWSPWRC